MIDIVRDYASIGVGAAQAATTSVLRTGRSAVGRVTSVVEPSAWSGPEGGASAREVLDRGRGAVGGLLRTDLDGVVTRLGLAKRSEVNAVRQQLQRIERRLGDVRGER